MLLQYLAMLCLPFLLFAQIERFRKYNCLDPNIHISITFISPTEKQFIVSNGKKKKKKRKIVVHINKQVNKVNKTVFLK